MVGYCEALGACRRAFIAGYFGDVNATCGVHQAPCDVCRAAQRGQVLQQQEARDVGVRGPKGEQLKSSTWGSVQSDLSLPVEVFPYSFLLSSSKQLP